ncbi:MAG TPA: alpha-ketoacid dehydrogenase subunit beta [Caldisericia bacterium]|nr:alpha-ketoacid dehydrogenase subunit beta [Caldisericia bacterium]
MKTITYVQAINEALREEMARDKTVIVMGEDVRASVFGATGGLLKEFGPDRVRDTPISEPGFTGAGVGAAASGLRPVVDIMMGNFMYVAMDQFLNQMAKLRFMSGGQVNFPVTVHAILGAGGGAAAQHSDHPVSYFVHTPIFKVVLPSTPYDAKGLLKSAIRDDNPVIFFEETTLGPMKQEIPEEEYLVPIGKGDIKRGGNDVTIVAVGCMVPQALSAAEKLQAEGISVEVVDPRTLVPLDKEIILNSIKKTGRLVVTEDDTPMCSFASEVMAIAAEEGFSYLKAPVRRVTRVNVPIPFSPPMEKFVLPNEEKIIKAVKEVLS